MNSIMRDIYLICQGVMVGVCIIQYLSCLDKKTAWQEYKRSITEKK